jgi:hypothetical protein
MPWQPSGGGDRPMRFPTPVPVEQVAGVLDDEQRRVLAQYADALDRIDVARSRERERRTAVAAAGGDDHLAAVAALRAGEPVPGSVGPARRDDHDRARRGIAAAEALAAEALRDLHGALVPAQDELVTRAWAALADLDLAKAKPTTTRRAVTACLWALAIDRGPSPPAEAAVTRFAGQDLERLTAEARAETGRGLDELGGLVVEHFAGDDDAEVRV